MITLDRSKELIPSVLRRLLEEEGIEGADALEAEIVEVDRKIADLESRKVPETSKGFTSAREMSVRLRAFQMEIAELQSTI